MAIASIWSVSDDCKATLLLCHEFGGRALPEDARPLTVWEYGQLVRFLKELGGRPSDLLQADTAEPILSKLPSELPSGRVRGLLSRGLSLSLSLETWRSRGIWVIGRGDLEYPKRLKDRFGLQAPPVLFGVGDPKFLNDGGLGVFGSRNVDAEGEAFAANLGKRAATEKLTILSGCARGVDWASMSGCLDEGGLCIGVIAERLDRASVSPQYREYIRQDRLVLVSMFAPEAPFLASHAKGRDKYTYALSDYGVVVAAETNKGGTWAGATEQLRRLKHVPVFVRSAGNIPSGNAELLSMGGRPFPSLDTFESIRAFLEGRGSLANGSSTSPVSPTETSSAVLQEEESSTEDFALSPDGAAVAKSKSDARKKRMTSKPSGNSRAALDEATVAKAIRVLVSGDGEGMSFWKLGGDGELRAWLDVVNFTPFSIKIDRIVGEVLVRNTTVGRLHHLKRENVEPTSDSRIYVQSDLSPEQIKKIEFQLSQPGPADVAGLRLTIYIETVKGSLELNRTLSSGNVRFVNFGEPHRS